MLKTFPTKRGTGISIFGLADDLQYMYNVIHLLANSLDEGDLQLKGRHQLLMNFAYEVRKAYQGQRLKKPFIQASGEEIIYYGFNIVWTDILIFQNVLRGQAGYMETTKRLQSVLYALEAGITDALNSYDPESAEEIIAFTENRFLVRGLYCFIIYQAVHIEFVLQPSGKRRFKKLPELLGSYFSEYHDNHTQLIESLKTSAKQQNCEITDLGYAEFPEIKW